MFNISYFAPLMISTYHRLSHLRATIDSLSKCELATQTQLYIFSDGARAGDEDEIESVREYLRGLIGTSAFKHVHVIERESNYGAKKNNRQGIEEVLGKHGKVIFLEDDNKVASGFLVYMNQALALYQSDSRVLSICGYTPPIADVMQSSFKSNSSDDIFAFPRFVAWGVGFWSRSYPLMQPISSTNLENLNKTINVAEFGDDLINRFRAEVNGHLDSLDTRATFYQLSNQCFSIFPKNSLVQNIGQDGSGLHSGISSKFDVALWDKQDDFNFPDNLQVCPDMQQRMSEFFSISEDDMSSEVLDNILSQIQHLGWKSVSLWGIDTMTQLMLPKLKQADIKVNYLIDSWAREDEMFQAYSVINLQDAYAYGELHIVIMSFASRFKMAEILNANYSDVQFIHFVE